MSAAQPLPIGDYLREQASIALDSQAMTFTRDDVLATLKKQIGPVSEERLPDIARALLEDALKAAVKNAVDRKSRIRPLMKGGQFDYLAAGEQLLKLDSGELVHRKDADVLQMMRRRKQVDNNIDAAIAARDEERAMEDPVIEYMMENKVARFEDACKALGYL